MYSVHGGRASRRDAIHCVFNLWQGINSPPKSPSRLKPTRHHPCRSRRAHDLTGLSWTCQVFSQGAEALFEMAYRRGARVVETRYIASPTSGGESIPRLKAQVGSSRLATAPAGRGAHDLTGLPCTCHSNFPVMYVKDHNWQIFRRNTECQIEACLRPSPPPLSGRWR